MKKIIVVAGATGDLGFRIVKYLIANGGEVRALVRPESPVSRKKMLRDAGAGIFLVQNWNPEELTPVCTGASCVVSAVAGLYNVVVEAQKVLLNAAIAGKVPRFIPSDYSLDFTKFSHGENRNLDLRREFHTYLDEQPIAATSIFNGAFAGMLLEEIPMILSKRRLILHWGNSRQKLDFTTRENSAAFTAHVALDSVTPRYLRIAGDQISAREIRDLMSEIKEEKFCLLRTGGQGLLGFIIKIARKISPAENELYPAWQGMQYMHNMIDKRAVNKQLDNDRYPQIKWSSVPDVLKKGFSV